MDHVRPAGHGAPGAPASDPASDRAAGEPARLAGLLARCARGDETAFAEFYDATAARAYGLALRVVRNPAHAEEVTQEAYLDAWRASGRHDPARGSATGWLLAIVHRRAVDRVRSVEAAASRDEAWLRASEPVDHDQTVESAHAALEAARVRTALAALTETQRRAVELAYFGGCTHTELAALLDVPLGTAKTRVRDALIRLRAEMGAGS